MLPFWFTRCRTNPTVLGVANAFAGGIFVAIAFLHIMPEAKEQYENNYFVDFLPQTIVQNLVVNLVTK